MNITALETKARGGYRKLVANDVVKAAVMLFLTTLGAGIYKFIDDSGRLPTFAEFKPYAITALLAGASLLLKNYYTNSDGQLLKKENTNIIVTKDVDPFAPKEEGQIIDTDEPKQAK